ncbi:hypothetical protein EYF80_029825 [Liparis tanakae]|uniref:Uncharacterized protein n=1 Tax=Liparis tanakae TaxID=230148 RepID=A0A4Z2H4G7_9TELE|nr:hypothetical protein EYF80_029825 [Liparis tanakae]
MSSPTGPEEGSAGPEEIPRRHAALRHNHGWERHRRGFCRNPPTPKWLFQRGRLSIPPGRPLPSRRRSSLLVVILAAEANSTIAPLLYSMWPSLRGAGYQAD